MPTRFTLCFLAFLSVLLLFGCTLGPDYVRPKMQVPLIFKEQKGWKKAQPNDYLPTGQWWQIFHDADLNQLVEKVSIGNQSLAEAEFQYRQAQHLVQSARSAYFPMLSGSGTANRFRAASGQSVAVSGVRYLFGTALNLAWEPDLWGSIRRQVEANTSSAQASAATLQALRLSSQAMLAQNYFQLRTLDNQRQLLTTIVDSYQKALNISQNRYKAGIVDRSVVLQAQTQLETSRAQLMDLGVQRAQLEHAIAVLIGKAPADFELKAKTVTLQPPVLPGSVPSELLERRPDIAAAERQVAATNAQIGVATAAYFPSLNLAATNGYQSNALATLFDMGHRYWALGPAGVALTLLDGGNRNAQLKQVKASFEASVAHYKQTVLTGFQEVEDSLAALRITGEELKVQEKAAWAAQEALSTINNQFKAGTVSYLEVMTAQAQALSNQQAVIQLQGEQLIYAVQLIKALGGGWHSKTLPSSEEAGGKIRWQDSLPFPVD